MASNLDFKGPFVAVLKWTQNCPLEKTMALPPAIPRGASLWSEWPSVYARSSLFYKLHLNPGDREGVWTGQ